MFFLIVQFFAKIGPQFLNLLFLKRKSASCIINR